MTPQERERLLKQQPPPRERLSDAERAKLPRLDTPPVAMGPPRLMNMLPRKYSETLEQNQKLNLCCRHVDEEGHTGQMFATPTAARDEQGNVRPDLLIVVCGKCNRKHYRVAVGSISP